MPVTLFLFGLLLFKQDRPKTCARSVLPLFAGDCFVEEPKEQEWLTTRLAASDPKSSHGEGESPTSEREHKMFCWPLRRRIVEGPSHAEHEKKAQIWYFGPLDWGTVWSADSYSARPRLDT